MVNHSKILVLKETLIYSFLQLLYFKINWLLDVFK